MALQGDQMTQAEYQQLRAEAFNELCDLARKFKERGITHRTMWAILLEMAEAQDYWAKKQESKTGAR